MVPVRNEPHYPILEDSSSSSSSPKTPFLSTKRTNACLICPPPPPPQKEQNIVETLPGERIAPLFPFAWVNHEDEERMLHSLKRLSLKPRITSHSSCIWAAALGAENTERLPAERPTNNDIMTCPKIPLCGDHDVSRAPSQHVLVMKHRNRGFL